MLNNKALKKPGIIFLGLFLVVLSFLAVRISFADDSPTGTGTLEDPFILRTCQHLQDINNNLSANYKLANDINCSETATWNPVYAYTGVDIGAAGDGSVYQIPHFPLREGTVAVKVYNTYRTTGFVINYETGVITFDGVASTTYSVSNTRRITVDYETINPGYYEGFMPIGSSTNQFTGSLDGAGYKVVGIKIDRASRSNVGLFGYTSTTASIGKIGMTDFSIVGYNFVGSLVGYNYGSLYESYALSLPSNYNEATITATSPSPNGQAGGLIGLNRGSITNCYARNSVNGYLGAGLVSNQPASGSIINSYAVGIVNNSGTNKGLVGYPTSNYGVTSNSFWDKVISGQNTSYGGVGTTTSILNDSAIFISAGWDFENIWAIDANKNDGFPYLLNSDSGPDRPIEISTVEDLQNIANNPGRKFVQTADIDASDTATWNDGAGFLPIDVFYGLYDGNGFVITNLKINRPTTDYIGVFGYNRGIINNFKIADSSILGQNYVGGIVAYNISQINRSASYRLNDSSNEIIGSTYVGGLVGVNNPGKIFESYVVANVSSNLVSDSNEYVGGLTGSNSGEISNCYTRGIFKGYYASGITGGFPSSGKIINSFAAGVIVDTTTVGGGLAGYRYSGYGDAYNSFWDLNITSRDASPGGGLGTTTDKMKNLSTFMSAGWNFETVWGLDTNKNNGYPYLINNNSGVDIIREISTIEDLQNIANNPGDRFIQTADIDASSTATWNDGAGFLPIDIFYGIYDGNGFTIDNLKINYPDRDYLGVFSVNHGSISNLKLSDSFYAGNNYVGSIAGYNWGTIYRSKSYRLNDSSNQITGYNYVGGLVGYNNKVGSISESYAVANVTRSGDNSIGYTGGLVGRNQGAILNSYSRGSVQANYNAIGGLVGHHGSGASIVNSFSASVVGGTASSPKGFIGYPLNSFGSVANSFWDINVSGQLSNYAGGVGTTTSAMKTLSTFTNAGWDFENVWHMDGIKNDGYPYLNPPILPVIEISTIEELQNIANSPDFNYIQIADIDASSTAAWNDGAGFLPLPTFTGSYDGNGFVIKNLVINRASTDYVGVFSQNRGSIRRLSLLDSDIRGNNYVGSIAGYNWGTIYRSKSYRLNDSSNQITGYNYVGGLVGYNNKVGSISESYAVANVTRSGDNSIGYTGGLVGRNQGAILNSYSRGSVQANYNYIGGLTGYHGSGASIVNSFSASVVGGTASNPKGFIGYPQYSFGSVTKSFWDINVSGRSTTFAGGVGTTTLALKTLATFTNAGWDFENVWGLDVAINSGYPYQLFESSGFVETNFSLIINRVGEGSITANGSTYLAPLALASGTEVSLVAIPADGWRFDKWEDDSTSTSRTLTIAQDESLTANFLEIDGGSGDDEGEEDPGEGDDDEDDGDQENNGNQNNRGGVARTIGSALLQISAPQVVANPIISGGSLIFNVANAFQMAISRNQDFSGSSWLPYNPSLPLDETLVGKLYVKFRSPDGGESNIFNIDTTNQQQTATATSNHQFTQNFKLGQTNSQIKELQKFLNANGFLLASSGPGSAGQETTKFGALTRQALINFQRANNLPATGELNEATRESIQQKTVTSQTSINWENNFTFTRNLRSGEVSSDVKELQKFLNANGFALTFSGLGSAGQETTKFGALTRQALIKFQRANNIYPASGYFGPITRKFINSR